MGGTPATTAFSRVFVIEGGARGDHRPRYESCLKAGGIDQSFGDVERIECPSGQRYGQFEEVGQIRGATERPTTNLTGRYQSSQASDLLAIARKGCAIDVQVHFGTCTNPSDFNRFAKAVIYEGAFLTNFSTDDLGALGSDEQAVVNESADLSASLVYEILPLTFARRADDLVTNQLLDVVICDTTGCGDCGEESDGCSRVYAITSAAGGSPSTPADVVFSLNKGETWYVSEIDSLGAAEAPTAIACIGGYLVVFSNASGSLHYVEKADVDETSGGETWVEVATGFDAAGPPNDAWSVGSRAFVVGDGGYVYICDDPTAGVTEVDAGVASAQDLNAVHAISEDFAVAVGNLNAVIKTENGVTWTGVTGPRLLVNLNCIQIKGEQEWWVGTADGRLYYTLNGGTSWTEKTFPGSGSGTVHDIAFATGSVAYLAHATAAGAGRILRSYDGGYSWQVMPEGAGILPANDRVNALAACEQDVNFVVGVGLGDGGTGGFLTVGRNVRKAIATAPTFWVINLGIFVTNQGGKVSNTT